MRFFFDWHDGFHVFAFSNEEGKKLWWMDDLLAHGGPLLWMPRSFRSFCKLLGLPKNSYLGVVNNFIIMYPEGLIIITLVNHSASLSSVMVPRVIINPSSAALRWPWYP